MTMLLTTLAGNVDNGNLLENNDNSSSPMSNDNTNKNEDEAVLYDRYMTILNTLPEGWSRNPKAGSVNGEAPFVHASTGKVSWKHPNQAQLTAFLQNEQQKRQGSPNTDSNAHADADADALQYQVRPTTINGVVASSSSSSLLLSSKHEQKMIKKLRLMLQAGAPLEVVERRAAVENIDISEVLLQPQQQQQNEMDGSKKCLVTNTSINNNNSSNSNVMVSPVLLKKYSKSFCDTKVGGRNMYVYSTFS
jgi:hypothetical protein